MFGLAAFLAVWHSASTKLITAELIHIRMVFQVLVHPQALQVAGQDLDLQVGTGEEAQVQDHQEVLAPVVLDLALPGVLALGVLVLDLNIQLCGPVLLKCRLFKACGSQQQTDRTCDTTY